MEPSLFNLLEVSFDLEKKRGNVQFHPRLYALHYIAARRGFPRVDRKGNFCVGWSHGKTCSKNEKLVFATLLQNELNSDVKRATNQVVAVAKSVGAE